MYGQGHLIKKRKRSRPTPIVNKNPAASTSASASAATLVGEYEVFLSFRGADTRNDFTDYLYNDLVSAGVCTFRDDNELRVGEEIGPNLLRAIKQSKISIPIFSKNYAYSKWCLREFAQMMECRKNGEQIIYPIFYDVEPSEVQHYERGSYKAAFLQHDNDKNLDEKIVQQWKTALKIVGDLKGWELQKITNGRQGELVKIIVKEVLSKLKNYKHVPENLVGMYGHIKEMERLINIDFNGVRIIGILGMGGLGKTTIAKVIYDQFCELFECHCFIEDVRENSNTTKDIVKLQERLVSEILKRKSKFNYVREGIEKIKGAVHQKKVLIVLDDVDQKSPIDKLVGNHSWYRAGSRLIITTRDEDALLALERTYQKKGLHEIYRCYSPNLMNDNLALELFSKYAFMADSPPKGYDALAMDVVSHAGGLPLVLVTLGSLLFIEKDKVSWQEKLRKLKAMTPEEVLERLRISYDALDNAQQQIFLDIGCLFSGLDKTNPCYMWDDCEYYPREGINALVRRSLIKVGDDNRLWMHDRLRELAEQITCEKYCNKPRKWSKSWRYEDAWNMLKTHLEGTFTDVELLCLNPYDVIKEIEDYDENKRRLDGQNFRKLPNLRYLEINSLELNGDYENLLQNLRWLHSFNCRGNCAPTNLHLKNLVVLELLSCDIRDDWSGWSQIKKSEKLKVLNLWNCNRFRRIPHLRAFPTLERLEVEGCELLCRLDGLDELKSLEYLKAKDCTALKSLPDLSKLRRLQTLNVQSCKKLTEIQGLDKLESLEVLDTSSCRGLKRLPNLSNLRKLTRFASSGCKKLVEIQGLDRLASLEDLDIEGCESLKSWPDLSNSKKLRKLSCGGLNLTEVQSLHVPESLEHLFMNDLHRIKRLPDMSNLRWLKILQISSCYKLKEIQELDGLESLETLNMSDCQSLKTLPDLSNLKKLKYLNIACFMLLEIQGLDRLESLEHLEMHECRLKVIPDLPSFGILKHIGLSNCLQLQDVKTLRAVESLESLKLSPCSALEISGFEEPESLELLNVPCCTSIKNLTDLSNLTNLKRLDVSCCLELTELRGLEELKSLEMLNVRGCMSINNLPDLSNLTNLKKLDVSYCVELTELRGLEELKSLTRLLIVGCVSLKNLPCLPNTKIRCDYEDEESSDYLSSDGSYMS